MKDLHLHREHNALGCMIRQELLLLSQQLEPCAGCCKTATQSSNICHDLPPLIVLSAELHIRRHYSHLNCDDDSQGTNHKAETKDVVEVALQSTQIS